jgi:hypothetical protein
MLAIDPGMDKAELRAIAVRAISRIWDDAGWAALDDDHFFDLVMLMDPDGSIDREIRQLEDDDYERERAAMTQAQRDELDEAGQRGIERGLEIIVQIMARESSGAFCSDPAHADLGAHQHLSSGQSSVRP